MAFVLWRPTLPLATVQVQPLLASWDAAVHPAQRRLRTYLERVESVLRPATDGRKKLYLDVHVRIPEDRDLLHHCDLENYLTPIAQRLRDLDIVYARATKAHDGESRISIGIAEPYSADWTSWHHFQCHCRGSAGSEKWKHEIADALRAEGHARVVEGPLAMHLAWSVSKRRNWINLWKPTGDALGPILGVPNPAQPFSPADDRITELHMHLARDEQTGFDVDIGVWWRSASAW